MNPTYLPAQTQGWTQFIELCLAQKSSSDLLQFFELFLTDEEKENLASRVLIVKALMENQLTQREIAKALNISIAKITRGSNMMKRMDKQFLSTLFAQSEEK